LSKHPSEPAPIKQRFIACVQSTGRIGKSMVADGILSWLTFAGIPHAAIDTDVQHHTLSDRYKMLSWTLLRPKMNSNNCSKTFRNRQR
jgi:hypothetical protein